MKKVIPDDRLIDAEFDAEMSERPWAVKVAKAAESTLAHVMRLMKSILRAK